MRIIFMGSQDLSVIFLQEIINAGHEIVAVFTREPKPAGRNQKLTKTPVHLFAEVNNLVIKTPKSLKNQDEVDLSQFDPIDFIVVVAYGLILPKYFIEYPNFACINVHPSILPRWRGAAPIERALWNGDKKTAATIMLMDEGLDTGDILSMEEIDINDSDDFETLSAKLADSAKIQLIEVINNFSKYKPIKQEEIGIEYAEKISSDDRKINFNNIKKYGCYEINNRIRALSSKSGLMIKLANLDEEFKIFKADYRYNSSFGEYGHGIIFDKKFYIICQDGVLIPKLFQKTIGKGSILNEKEFINSIKDKLLYNLSDS